MLNIVEINIRILKDNTATNTHKKISRNISV